MLQTGAVVASPGLRESAHERHRVEHDGEHRPRHRDRVARPSRAVRQRGGEIPLLSVHDGSHRRLGQAGPDRGGEVHRRGSRGKRTGRPVGKEDCDVGHTTVEPTQASDEVDPEKRRGKGHVHSGSGRRIDRRKGARGVQIVVEAITHVAGGHRRHP